MSENEELEEEIGDAVKKSDRVIEIKHTGIVDKKEFDQIKNERDELKSQLGLIAERAFRDEKQSVLEQYPESRRDEIEEMIGNNPDILEQVRADLILHGSDNSTQRHKAPAGKAVLRQSLEEETFVQSSQKNEGQEFLDDLFERARVKGDKDAEAKIEELFESYYDGFKNREKTPNMPRQTQFVVSQCLKCGALLSGADAEAYAERRGACPYCGYNGGFVKHPKGQSY